MELSYPKIHRRWPIYQDVEHLHSGWSAADILWATSGLAVDAQGRLFVVDTGNKRIVVFDANGNYIKQFGSAGLIPGNLTSLWGLRLKKLTGTIYITDTWNQQIQSFAPSADGLTFTPLKQWDVSGWIGKSLDNKPFITTDSKGHIFITDPEAYRVIEYTTDGQLIQTWGDYGNSSTTFGIASGITVDAAGHVWVTDAGNDRIMRFTLP